MASKIQKAFTIKAKLENNPAAFVQTIVEQSMGALLASRERIENMLASTVIDPDTRTIMLAKMVDNARQINELAIAVANTFGKKPSQAPLGIDPATNFPRPEVSATFSPPARFSFVTPTKRSTPPPPEET
jgi:hypothetical protein